MGLIALYLLLFLVSVMLLVQCDAFPRNEVLALTTFKETIYEDPNLVLSNWNALDADPCEWSGITCNGEREHVLRLNISGSSLKGFLAPDLGQITYLQALNLHGNNLIGIIPKEFGMLKYLKVLDLGMNQLSGPIPPELGNLTSVTTINLQSNGLTGKLPAELGNLKFLQELCVDRNRLHGPIPADSSSEFNAKIHGMYASSANSTGFCRSAQLKVADFSYNYLEGIVPKCLVYLPSTSFQGNCLQDRNRKQRQVSECGGGGTAPKSHEGLSQSKHKPIGDTSNHHKTSKPAWLWVLEVATGSMVGCIFIVAIFVAVRRCKSKSSIIIPWKKSSSEKEQMKVYIDSELLKDVARFSRQELEVACEDFSNIIGSSPDSLVYKGTIKGGPEIAVISLCIKEENWTGYLELYFQKEVADLARLNNENTGKLLGYCTESSPFTRMLVFAYASNGTLYENLHYGEARQLSWTRRMKIAIGIARGLKYLHADIEPPFTISELNSGAIYLTEDFSPKLVDFESWKTILARSEKNSGSIGSNGAICVLPNSLEKRHLDIQGNIYAFGIILLELISGRPPYCKEKGCLVTWAKQYLELPEVMSYIVDPELKHFSYTDLKVICEVATLCLQDDPFKRPLMQEVTGILESRIDTSVSAELKASSLAWAELALSS